MSAARCVLVGAAAEPMFPMCDQSPLIVGQCACSVLAEAWAWRCADQMPDSAQSKADALADAETLEALVYATYLDDDWPMSAYYARAHCNEAARLGRMAIRLNADPWLSSLNARGAANAVYRACPGLRDQP